MSIVLAAFQTRNCSVRDFYFLTQLIRAISCFRCLSAYMAHRLLKNRRADSSRLQNWNSVDLDLCLYSSELKAILIETWFWNFQTLISPLWQDVEVMWSNRWWLFWNLSSTVRWFAEWAILQVKLTFRGTFRSTHGKGISGPKSLFAAGVSFRSKARPNVKIQPCKFN